MTKITTADEPDLRARVERGETCVQIAAAYKCTDKSVSKRLRDMGLSTKRNSMVKLEVEEAVKTLWFEGHSGTQIGRKLKMTRNAVVSLANRRNWLRDSDIARQNARIETQRYRGLPTVKTASAPRIGIAGNGATFEHAPAAEMPRLRDVAATGVPARIADDHWTRLGCKWPIGTPPAHDASEQLFCNGKRAPGEARYCCAHLKVALNPNQPKRKDNPPPLGGGHAYRYGERRFG